MENRRREIFSYLAPFANLKAIGRSGAFSCLHIHDLLLQTTPAVTEIQEKML